jgi:hypothetical protein
MCFKSLYKIMSFSSFLKIIYEFFQASTSIVKVHSQMGYQKKVSNWKRIAKDNFGFLFILHYCNCNGLLYANR